MAADDDHKTSEIRQSLLLAAAILLAAVSGTAGIVQHVAKLGPHVGDLVAFDPARRASFNSDVRLAAGRPDQPGCVLDVATMQRSGGSLVLERRIDEPSRVYRAHWAGPRTSDDAGDCGTEADLTLSLVDIDTLATAAGGFGVDHTSALLLR